MQKLQPPLWKGIIAFGIVLALPLLLRAKDTTLTITKIDGTQLIGEIVAWNASEINLQKESESLTIASPQLLRIQWQHSTQDAPIKEKFLELVNGTRLPHKGYEVQEGKATVKTTLAEQLLTLSTNRIAYVQLSIEAPEQKNYAHDLDGDILVLRKKKTGNFDNLAGILGNVTPKQVEFTWDGETIPVKRAKVVALAYFHARKPAVQQPICWLHLLGGGRLPIVEILRRDQNVKVKTTGGLEFLLPLESLRDADYSQGKLAYLSDLQPIEQHWTPRIGLPASAELIQKHGLPRRDQSYAGSALALRWPSAKTASVAGDDNVKTYQKGLAMRSRTDIRYRLPKGMRRFTTLAGIDPETASQGNVDLEIFTDNRSVWQGEIDGEAAPTEINVALSNARELRIVVDYGKNLDFGDRLHLIEARLSK